MSNSEIDCAFLRSLTQIVSSLPENVRRCPSAVPSPILRYVLLHGDGVNASVEKSSENTHGKRLNQEENPSNLSVSSSAAVSTVTGENSSSHLTSLAQRGLLPKDPLLKRLQKKQIQVKSNSDGDTTKETERKFWFQKKLSEMNEVSWSVFKNQIGLVTELTTFGSANVNGAHNQRNSAAVVIPHPIRCWEEAQLPSSITASLLRKYQLPTAVQSQCIPLIFNSGNVLENSTTSSSEVPTTKLDVLCVADTGSGKTAAYVVPLIANVCRILAEVEGSVKKIKFDIHDGPIALVVVPTKELVEQVYTEMESFLSDKAGARPNSGENDSLYYPLSKVKLMKVYGGTTTDARTNTTISATESTRRQYEALSGEGCHLLVATLGQLQSLLELKYVSLINTQYMVLDEADRMLEHQETSKKLTEVLEQFPRESNETGGNGNGRDVIPLRQLMLFTATLDKRCGEIARRYMSRRGFVTVKTSQHCNSIRQSFEVFSSHARSYGDEDEKEQDEAQEGDQNGNNNNNRMKKRKLQNKQYTENNKNLNEMIHKDLIHPEKLNRLVNWLCYAKGPIIVFANEKSVCDALEEELARIAAYLQAAVDDQQLTNSNNNMSSKANSDSVYVQLLRRLVGDAPEGLHFEESPEVARRNGGTQVSASSSKQEDLPSLENLTSVAVVHASLTANERQQLLELFTKQGNPRRKNVLITTDLFARGLDVPGVSTVINYDMPAPFITKAENSHSNDGNGGTENNSYSSAFAFYIHRVGRTGRAGAVGVAVSFIVIEEELLEKSLSGPAGRANLKEEQADFSRVKNNNTSDDEDDESGDEDDDDENNVMNEKGNVGLKRRRKIVIRDGKHNNRILDSYYYFAPDNKILPFLYKFLMGCLDTGNSASASVSHSKGKRDDSLLKLKYKIVLPVPLYTIMMDMMNSSTLGTITA